MVVALWYWAAQRAELLAVTPLLLLVISLAVLTSKAMTELIL
jgi:hypothetical protein